MSLRSIYEFLVLPPKPQTSFDYMKGVEPTAQRVHTNIVDTVRSVRDAAWNVITTVPDAAIGIASRSVSTIANLSCLPATAALYPIQKWMDRARGWMHNVFAPKGPKAAAAGTH